MLRRPGRPVDGSAARDQLLDGCWTLLQTQSAPSVAAVCELAQCTPPTLYHHFGDVAGLRQEACARAFKEWAEGLERQIGSSPDPLVRLRRRGQAYVDWGVANPTAYRILFLNPPIITGHGQLPGAGFDLLLVDLAAATGMSIDDPRLLIEGMAYWSAVHGLTSLTLTNPALPADVRTAVLHRLTSALTQQTGEG